MADAMAWAKVAQDVVNTIGQEAVSGMTWEEVESAWMDCPLMTVTAVDYHRGIVTMGLGNG